jgi:hypothetical protein
VPNRVTSEEQYLVPGSSPKCLIEREEDLGVRAGTVSEVPTLAGGTGAHLRAPLAEGVLKRISLLLELLIGTCHRRKPWPIAVKAGDACKNTGHSKSAADAAVGKPLLEAKKIAGQ